MITLDSNPSDAPGCTKTAPNHVATVLRRRAFEIQDLELWMARNDRRLVNWHDAKRHLESLKLWAAPTGYTLDQWWGGSWDEFFRESSSGWDEKVRLVRACYRAII